MYSVYIGYSRTPLIMQSSHTFSKSIFHTFKTKIKHFNTITYLHFSKILFMEHNAENICATVNSGKEQNLNKQMVEFRISILL